MVLSQKAATAAIAGICVVFVGIRFFRLTDACLWFDEIFTVHAAEHSWDSILSFVALDLIHPPLFYILLKLWIGIGGDSLLWLRLFPVVFSVLAIVAFILLCRELKIGLWTHALALFLIAVNGSLIKYAQEVRMYSALLCVSLFSMWLFARYFRRTKSFAALLIVNIFLVHIQYFGLLVVASEVAAILIFQRDKWRRAAAMFAVVLASFIPWTVAVMEAANTGMNVGENISWMRRPGLGEIRVFVFDLIEPFYFQASTADPASLLRVAGPIFLITLTAAVLFIVRWNGQNEDDKRNVFFLGIFVALPLVTAFIGSWILPYSIWGTRHLTIVFVPAAILTAYAFVNISANWLRTGLITLLILFNGYGLAAGVGRPFVQPVWCGFDVLTKEIESKNPAPVYVFEDLAAYHVWFTLRKNNYSLDRMPIFKVINAQDMPEDKAYFLPRGFDVVTKVGLGQISGERFWFLYRATDSPLQDFAPDGYQVEDRIVFENKMQNIYAVLLRKR